MACNKDDCSVYNHSPTYSLYAQIGENLNYSKKNGRDEDELDETIINDCGRCSTMRALLTLSTCMMKREYEMDTTRSQ